MKKQKQGVDFFPSIDDVTQFCFFICILLEFNLKKLQFQLIFFLLQFLFVLNGKWVTKNVNNKWKAMKKHWCN